MKPSYSAIWLLLLCLLCSQPLAAPPAVAQSPETGVIRGHVHSFSSHKTFVHEEWKIDGTSTPGRIVQVYDFDLDGRSDLVCLDTVRREISVMLSYSPGTFRKGPVFALPEGAGEEVLVGQFNVDNRTDFFVWSKNSPNIRVGIQQVNGSLAWSEKVFHDHAFVPANVVAADFSGDGTDDWLAWGTVPTVWTSLFRLDDPAGAFLLGPTNFGIAAPPVRVLAVFDFDGNHLVDFLVTGIDLRGNPSDDIWAASLRAESGTFLSSSLGALSWDTFLSGDFDGDGRDDLLLRATVGLSPWWVALSAGKMGFPLALPGIFLGRDIARSRIFIGDFDGDGLGDIGAADSALPTVMNISFSRMSAPVSDAVLELDTGGSTKTDEHGYFEFRAVPPGVRRVKLLGTVPTSFRTEDEFFVGPGKIRRISFLESGKAKARVGAPVARFAKSGGPYICQGEPSAHTPQNLWGSTPLPCADHYAVVGVNRGVERNATCCRLPSDDILNGRVAQAVDFSCPDNSVVTSGIRLDCSGPECSRELRCSEINTDRYQLGVPRGGKLFGEHNGVWDVKGWTPRDELPLGVRLGLERRDFFTWNACGCIGTPTGSLLVRLDPSRYTDRCERSIFRELQYRGRPGDPPRGTPVKMFPDCASIDNPYDPTQGCIPSEVSASP